MKKALHLDSIYLHDGPIMKCLAKGQLMHVKHQSDGKLQKIRARFSKNIKLK